MPPAPDDREWADGLNETDLFGETFAMNPSSEYEWEMMEFARSAKNGADSDLLSGAASVHEFLQAIIHANDWDRFRATAKANKATVADDLMPIVVGAFVQQTARPTSRPSDSSAGPKTTRRKSASVPAGSAKVIRRMEKKGRPDLALMVSMADEARSAASA